MLKSWEATHGLGFWSSLSEPVTVSLETAEAQRHEVTWESTQHESELREKPCSPVLLAPLLIFSAPFHKSLQNIGSPDMGWDFEIYWSPLS